MRSCIQQRPGRNNAPIPMEGVQVNEQGHDDGEKNVGDSENGQEEREEEDVGESFDTLEGEDFGPPEGLALRPAV